MATKSDVLAAARDVLRSGGILTIDAVAREAGLTKAGVLHHCETKEALVHAVVDDVMTDWEAELHERVSEHAGPAEKLGGYLDYALTADFDPGDLAFLADARLRDALVAQWVGRLDPWFGTALSDPVARTVRLLADGAWFDRALGIVDLSEAERGEVLALGRRLIDREMGA